MSGPNFTHREKPFEHQEKLLEEHWEDTNHAVFWEQGTGKTKYAIDTAALQYLAGIIDSVFVIAPNGVHKNWSRDEIPKHLTEDLLPLHEVFVWQTKKANTKAHQRAAIEALKSDRFLWVCMSYDATLTARGKKFMLDFFKKHQTFMVLDEAQRIKTPGAKRTKRLLAMGKRAVSRRVLTGTPILNGPFDAFSIVKFLVEDYWAPHGLDSFYAFKNYFGVFTKEWNRKAGKEYSKLVKYRRVDQLKEMLSYISSRVLKKDALDLPPKLYKVHYFEMSPEQKRVMTELKNNFMAELGDDVLTAPLAIVRITRYQQVTSGYLPIEGESILIDKEPPRITACMDVLDDLDGQVIIWAKYKMDIELICRALKEKKITHVRYDGDTSDDDRELAIEKFQHKQTARVFVGNPSCAGEGLTLHAAHNVIYYNNSYKLGERVQSEDRSHRIGQYHAVQYIDICAEDSIDHAIITSLTSKKEVSQVVLGDEITQWLM